MARRGDYSQPKLNARQKYLKRVEYNQQVAQLEGLYRNGATVEDVRAIRESWQTNTPYTVTDTDNLSTIANANGVTETDVLNANPDVKQLKTGMVINTPGSEAWRVQNAYKPGGLPSNAAQGAALGGLSTYREGSEAWRVQNAYKPGVTPPNPPAVNPNSRYIQGQQGNPLGNLWNSLFGQGPTQNPNMRTPEGIRPSTSNIQNPLGGLFSGSNQQPYTRGPGGVLPVANTATTTTHPVYGNPSPTTQRPQNQFNRPYSMNKDDSYPEELWYMIDKTDYVPTQAQMMYLRSQGYAVPSTVGGGGGGGGGGFSSNSRRGGGGRGRGGGAPRTPSGGPDYANTERLPAFGNGASFHGLINWRI